MTRHTAYALHADGTPYRHPFASFPHAEAARRYLAGHPEARVHFVPALPAPAPCHPDRWAAGCECLACSFHAQARGLGAWSPYTGHREGCATYDTLDASDCTCGPEYGDEDEGPGGTYADGVDYAWEAEYRAHSSSVTGVYEAQE
jgi:hypothetical protein